MGQVETLQWSADFGIHCVRDSVRRGSRSGARLGGPSAAARTPWDREADCSPPGEYGAARWKLKRSSWVSDLMDLSFEAGAARMPFLLTRLEELGVRLSRDHGTGRMLWAYCTVGSVKQRVLVCECSK
jgi:hypothetical protein